MANKAPAGAPSRSSEGHRLSPRALRTVSPGMCVEAFVQQWFQTRHDAGKWIFVRCGNPSALSISQSAAVKFIPVRSCWLRPSNLRGRQIDFDDPAGDIYQQRQRTGFENLLQYLVILVDADFEEFQRRHVDHDACHPRA